MPGSHASARRSPNRRRRVIAGAGLAGLVGAVILATTASSVRGGAPSRPPGPGPTTRSATTAPTGPPAALPAGFRWLVERRDAAGRPLLATASLTPPGTPPDQQVAVAWMSRRLRFHYVPGSKDPPGPWVRSGRVPVTDRSRLLVVFNAGFKLRDQTGGVATQGRVGVPLQRHEASMVFRRGHLSIEAWPGGPVPPPGITSVRQNLRLIVDHGHVPRDLTTRTDGSWSTLHHVAQRTGREALGVDARGDLLLVAGFDLDLAHLAGWIQHVGAVRGMELDIHSPVVTVDLFPAGGPAGGRKLLPFMHHPADRWLVPDPRDFVEALRP